MSGVSIARRTDRKIEVDRTSLKIEMNNLLYYVNSFVHENLSAVSEEGKNVSAHDLQYCAYRRRTKKKR